MLGNATVSIRAEVDYDTWIQFNGLWTHQSFDMFWRVKTSLRQKPFWMAVFK
ncbi:hypothetical protein SynMITS9220_00234 [Synechococcus sp. MIT S9220]|nr:hypothetical protein SynMITS9220_00234 [Synechococcus sp. MIT S9220]